MGIGLFSRFYTEKLKEAVLDYSRRRRRFGGNDTEEHFKFDPKMVAGLELQWQHALNLKQDEKFRDLVIRYVKEHYGLSKELAKTAGIELAKALVYGKKKTGSRPIKLWRVSMKLSARRWDWLWSQKSLPISKLISGKTE